MPPEGRNAIFPIPMRENCGHLTDDVAPGSVLIGPVGCAAVPMRSNRLIARRYAGVTSDGGLRVILGAPLRGARLHRKTRPLL